MNEIEYSDFLPIWKEFIGDAKSVLNVQMVAHHFYNLGLKQGEIQLNDLKAKNDALNLELGNEINIEEWAKAQRAVADADDMLMMLALPRKQWEAVVKCCEIALWHREKK